MQKILPAFICLAFVVQACTANKQVIGTSTEAIQSAVSESGCEYRGLVRTPAGGTFFPSEMRPLAAALPRLGLRGRVLEIGSGDGRVLSLLAHLRAAALPEIAEVVGVEIVPEYLEAARRARARLAPRLDFRCVREILGSAFDLDLGSFDELLWFAGGAMPEGEETAFVAKLAGELRADARLVAWGPDAGELDLRRAGELPLPGYHTLFVYRGRPER